MTKEVKVGLFAIISGAILYLGFNFLKGNDFFSSSNKFYAIYDNIDGLNVSNPVIVNGYSVGRVSHIEILQEQGNKVIVELNVNGGLIVGEGTSATLMNSDFLGSKAILLEIGDINRPIESGDTVKGKVDKGLAAILERAQPLTDDIGVTISRLNEILLGMEGAGEEIKNTIITLEGTIKTANSFIYKTDKKIQVTFDQVNLLLTSIKGRVDQLEPVLNNADSILTTVNGLDLDSAVNSLNATLQELELVVKAINEQEGSVGKLIYDDSLYTNLNKTIVDLDQLIIHFDENPKHYLGPLAKSQKKIEADRKKSSKD
ncbi:MAG: MlaD family protein [Reichenbachiella sp.]